MHHQEDVNVFFRGKSSEFSCNPILKVKFTVTFSLVRQHELHVINTDYTDIVVVYTCSKGLKNLFNWCRSVEVHKPEIILFEFFNNISSVVYILGLAVIKLGNHGFSEDLVLDFKTAPKGRETLC